MKTQVLSIALLMATMTAFAQVVDSARAATEAEQHEKVSPLTISGYVDAYYAYYTDSVKGAFQKFPTTSARSNSLGLNIAMVTVRYASEKVRATVSIHYGDIVQSSWATVPFNFLQEAHIGIRLHKKVWLDAGYFRSHIGTEGLYAKENITSSLAIGTFNEPYYEAGARLNYAPNDKLAFSFYLLNGYNIYVDNNKKKSFGMLATYAFNDNVNIGYSNYIGDDAPDSLSQLRTYHNFFLNYQKKKFKMQIGGDFATQMNSDTTGKKMATMFSALATFRYAIASKFGVYTRGEIFHDPQGFLAGTFKDKIGRQTGHKLWGVTAGIEYKPTESSYLRLEGRHLQCNLNDEMFRWNGKNQSNRTEVMIHMGYYF
ncbi:MAG TPA: outer membrane beta-barrel protein [Bacteroidia bacterium]